MPMPQQGDKLGPPKSVQFAHFGVLDAGRQNKSSLFFSLVVNAIALFVLIVISAANTKMIQQRILLTSLTFQPAPKVEPIKPKIVPPPPKPPPLPPKIQLLAPKIVVVKLPELPKPPEVKMDTPKPVIAPPAPVKVVPMVAPQVVNLAKPQAASVVNKDLHPAAVNLGSANAPTLHGPAVANVNLGRGLAGASGSGNGPAATKVNLGNGSPGGSLRGNGLVAVTGIPHGAPSGTGTAAVASHVNLGQATPPPTPKPVPFASLVQPKLAKLTAKPKPDYTEEARRLHIEGDVILRVRVEANGAVQILDLVSGLGHGLDESAKRAVLASRFEPATDGNGQAIPSIVVVTVTFQLAG
ncbi:MAG: energy transducer TonB [Acidobacteriaceae bacterium]